MTDSCTRLTEDKLRLLRQEFRNMTRLMIAFSGGVDSTFLLKVAHEELGKNVTAAIVSSPIFPRRETEQAEDFCKEMGISSLIIDSKELNDPEFCKNPVNRCYLCKKNIFAQILAAAGELGIKHIAEGSNIDDLNDYRPGIKAVGELKIHSPFLTTGFSKEEIRICSKRLGLSSWDKPSSACLCSRIPYGQAITKEKLEMIEKAEHFLRSLGFRQVRVRHHGDTARIELPPEDIAGVFKNNIAESITEYFSQLGFVYISLDLKGYRTGSMNEK